jgi:hypothetical protein
MGMNKKQEILRALEAMCQRYPEMRFGQMVANISSWAMGPKSESVWDVEDDAFLKATLDHLSSDKPNSNVC